MSNVAALRTSQSNGGVVDQQTLSHRAYAALSDWLISGRLRPGERLVNRTLAAELGLSMTPVREAINRLISDGAVEHVDGAGARVRRIGHREALQLYEIRCLLEPVAAQHAAENANQFQFDEIQRACEHGISVFHTSSSASPMLENTEILQLTSLDAEFHKLVIQAANNRWLERSLLCTRFVLKMFFAHFNSMRQMSRQSMRETWDCHQAIYAAIRRREGALARELMQQHLTVGQENFRNWIAGDAPSAATDGE